MLNPFTIEPTICIETVEYTCTGVSGPGGVAFDDLCNAWSTPNLSLTATPAQFLSGDLPEGTYTFTITATGLNG